MAPRGALKPVKEPHLGQWEKSKKKGVPAGSQKQGSAAQGLDLWGFGKTSHSEKSIAKTLGKTPRPQALQRLTFKSLARERDGR